jgi:hypothetical protein
MNEKTGELIIDDVEAFFEREADRRFQNHGINQLFQQVDCTDCNSNSIDENAVPVAIELDDDDAIHFQKFGYEAPDVTSADTLHQKMDSLFFISNEDAFEGVRSLPEVKIWSYEYNTILEDAVYTAAQNMGTGMSPTTVYVPPRLQEVIDDTVDFDEIAERVADACDVDVVVGNYNVLTGIVVVDATALGYQFTRTKPTVQTYYDEFIAKNVNKIFLRKISHVHNTDAGYRIQFPTLP